MRNNVRFTSPLPCVFSSVEFPRKPLYIAQISISNRWRKKNKNHQLSQLQELVKMLNVYIYIWVYYLIIIISSMKFRGCTLKNREAHNNFENDYRYQENVLKMSNALKIFVLFYYNSFQQMLHNNKIDIQSYNDIRALTLEQARGGLLDPPQK